MDLFSLPPSSPAPPLPLHDFHQAIREGNREKVSTCLKDLNHLSKKDIHGLSAYDYALLSKDPQMVSLILGEQAEQEVRLALESLRYEQTITTVKELQRNLIQELNSSSSKLPPLQSKLLSCSSQNLPAQINKHLAHLHTPDSRGRTPIHYAAALGSTRAVAELIRAGASVLEKDEDGIRALDLMAVWAQERDPLKTHLTEAVLFACIALETTLSLSLNQGWIAKNGISLTLASSLSQTGVSSQLLHTSPNFNKSWQEALRLMGIFTLPHLPIARTATNSLSSLVMGILSLKNLQAVSENLSQRPWASLKKALVTSTLLGSAFYRLIKSGQQDFHWLSPPKENPLDPSYIPHAIQMVCPGHTLPQLQKNFKPCKKAFRDWMKQEHPDKQGGVGESEAAKMGEAFNTLKKAVAKSSLTIPSSP